MTSRTFLPLALLAVAACGASNLSAAKTNSSASTPSTTASSTAASCDVSVQPVCPSTAPSYSGQVENIIATYCLQCHDPNGVGSAVATGSDGGAGRPADPNIGSNPNFARDPNVFQNGNTFNGTPSHWDPSDAHDWSKYANIKANVTLIEQQVFLCNMPPNGATPLSADDRAALLQWLKCGGPNN